MKFSHESRNLLKTSPVNLILLLLIKYINLMVRYFMKSNLYKLTVFKILSSTLSNYFMQDTLKNSTSKSDMLASHQLSDDDEDDTESIDMNTSVNPMLNTENTLDEEQETSSIQVTDVTVESTTEPKDRAERNSEEVGDVFKCSY